MNIKNCAIYTRVSTDNQAEKEFSSCESAGAENKIVYRKSKRFASFQGL